MEQMKRKERRLKYRGAIVDFYEDTMEAPDGKNTAWDYIEHRMGAAAVLPVLPDGKILLVRQHRNALDRDTLEIPAGARNGREEDQKICAARELEEETGYQAESLTPLLTVATTVAFCNEVIPVYLAEGLKHSKEQHLDEFEFIQTETWTLQALKEKVLSGEIQDSKTAAAILAYYAKTH